VCESVSPDISQSETFLGGFRRLDAVNLRRPGGGLLRVRKGDLINVQFSIPEFW